MEKNLDILKINKIVSLEELQKIYKNEAKRFISSKYKFDGKIMRKIAFLATLQRLSLQKLFPLLIDDDIEEMFVHNKGKFGIIQGDMGKILHHLKQGYHPNDLMKAAVDGKDLGIRIPLQGNASAEKPLFTKVHQALSTKRKKLDEAFDEVLTDEQVHTSYD